MAFGISEQTIEEIKARTDLADLIAGYGIPVKRAGGSYKACCPFHHEKTPSFNIQPSKGFYHCFGCGESGDVIKFVMKYEGLGFVEAAKKLAAAANITIEETNSDPQAAARITTAFPKPARGTKKGLKSQILSSEYRTKITELNCSHVAVDFPLEIFLD